MDKERVFQNDFSSQDSFVNLIVLFLFLWEGKGSKKGGGSDPCQDFSGEFEQSFARILNNLLPGFWNTRALSIVASRIYALFVAKSTSVPGLGGGGLS